MLTSFWILHIIFVIGEVNGIFRRRPFPHSYPYIKSDPCYFTKSDETINCYQFSENKIVDDKYINEFMKLFAKREISFSGYLINITDDIFAGIKLRKFKCDGCIYISERGDIFKDSTTSLTSLESTSSINMQMLIKSLEKLENLTSLVLTFATSWLSDSDKKSNITRFILPQTLKKLTLNHFKLNKMDKNTINPLPNLEYLNLCKDDIESMAPDTFSNFNNLKELILCVNHFSDSLVISGPHQLEKLDLSNNQFTNLSLNSFSNLESLKNLNISNNMFKIIPRQTFAGLKSLTQLGISSHWLETFEPGALDGLKNLEYLDITNTGIFKIIKPGFFNDLKKISSLKLINMKLETLEPGCFDGLNVAEIEISQNKITKLSTGLFSNLQKLASLKLTYNKIHEIEQNAFDCLHSLTHLCLSNNNINKINKTTFQTLSALHTLDLSENCIKEIEQGSFIGTNLTILNLSKNKLKTIPDFVSGVEHMLSLDLSNNYIEYISSNVFHNYVNLESLNLDGNKIKMLNDGVFQALINLNKLILRNNNMKSLSVNVFKDLKNLRDLDVPFKFINNLSNAILKVAPNIKRLNFLSNLDNIRR